MAYTPELSQKHSATLRRIAWALEMPMTKAIEEVFEYLSKKIDAKEVCKLCKDRTYCESCSFK